MKLQLKILLYLLKIIVIYSGTLCNFIFSKYPVNVLSYFHNLKKKKKNLNTDKKERDIRTQRDPEERWQGGGHKPGSAWRHRERSRKLC